MIRLLVPPGKRPPYTTHLERSVGKYFDHSLPSEERLEIMVGEACVLPALIHPRFIKILTLNSSGHDPLGHATKPPLAQNSSLTCVQEDLFSTILLLKWRSDPSFTINHLFALVDPNAPHVARHVPSATIRHCEAYMHWNRKESQGAKLFENVDGAMGVLVKELKEHPAQPELVADTV
jgi:hypothetical protein